MEFIQVILQIIDVAQTMWRPSMHRDALKLIEFLLCECTCIYLTRCVHTCMQHRLYGCFFFNESVHAIIVLSREELIGHWIRSDVKIISILNYYPPHSWMPPILSLGGAILVSFFFKFRTNISFARDHSQIFLPLFVPLFILSFLS